MKPLALSADTPKQELTTWRSVQATGQWRNGLTLLLANRNHKGRPGYWVATPLEIESGQAVLVLRGWIPRPTGANQALPELDNAHGFVTIEGELLSHVPRLFELWSFSDSDNNAPNLATSRWQGQHPPPEVQNLSLQDAEAATGLKLMSAVLQQTSADTLPNGTALVQEWATPQTDADKNRGYALQWFAFATIAAGAWLVVAWRAWRRRRNSAHPTQLKE